MILLHSAKALAIACTLISLSPATSAREAMRPGKHASRGSELSSERFAAPSFAIAPRTIGVTFGSNYFDRSAYAGPSQRGRAFNVRRKDS